VDLSRRFALGGVHSEHFGDELLDEEPRHEQRENVAEKELAEGK